MERSARDHCPESLPRSRLPTRQRQSTPWRKGFASLSSKSRPRRARDGAGGGKGLRDHPAPAAAHLERVRTTPAPDVKHSTEGPPAPPPGPAPHSSSPFPAPNPQRGGGGGFSFPSLDSAAQGSCHVRRETKRIPCARRWERGRNGPGMKANGSQILGIPARPAQCSDYLFRTLPRCTVVCTLVRSGLASRRRGSTGTQVSNGGGGHPPNHPFLGPNPRGFAPVHGAGLMWAGVGAMPPPCRTDPAPKPGAGWAPHGASFSPRAGSHYSPPPLETGCGGVCTSSITSNMFPSPLGSGFKQGNGGG